MASSGKVVAITGGASGIGLETAKLLASHGAKLSICDLQQRALEEAKREVTKSGGDVMVTALDVRERTAVEAWIKDTVQKYGKIDGAVNAAGVGGRAMLIETIDQISDDDFDLVWDVNVKGMLHSLRAEIPAMNDGGSIVNIASLAGLTGGPKTAAYTASKHAVVGLSRVATKELGARNIRVNCVCPGPIETPLLASTSAPDPSVPEMYKKLSPLGRNGKPKEVAALIEWLLSEGASFVNGTTQVIDGGVYCH
ncbi:uncharacterized protein A1O5_08926 [Cladophialophora psammophila CBS 110553]|uniref:Ketoreductase domain-containing protein n=1 Tax=Cladophialophora psammophila CBS 110553 TaxID=1182543 RepID=W9WUI4_9EURO|nr:uncharacterized protein A1O5_08926 [Cladophialophora psammophila CBS 110553]EXJ68311.1 hypothetical protein A1O5_08926 [Cladophialophora psammophila CBS 110553]